MRPSETPDLDPDMPPLDEDPWQAWILAHQEEYLSHAGQVVGIHPTRGILASATSTQALLTELARLGVRPEDPVLVAKVLPPGFVPTP